MTPKEFGYTNSPWEEKPLGKAAIECNIEYYKAQRIKAHSEYLKAKRQERYWREQLNKSVLLTTSDSVVT